MNANYREHFECLLDRANDLERQGLLILILQKGMERELLFDALVRELSEGQKNALKALWREQGHTRRAMEDLAAMETARSGHA